MGCGASNVQDITVKNKPEILTESKATQTTPVTITPIESEPATETTPQQEANSEATAATPAAPASKYTEEEVA